MFNDHGARNVWVADKAADGRLRGRPLTHYVGDDGIDLGEIAWAPDGQSLAFTRGGDLEGGAPPNPTSNVAGPVDQDVFIANLADGTTRRIGPGHSAVISPKGDRMVFINGGQIFTAPLHGGGAPAQLMHDRGTDSTLIFSPDGSRLAFVSARSGRTLIGVLDLATRHIAWMAPSVDSDIAPEWSPDGSRIAFVRVPAGEDVIDFMPHRSGEPWSIYVADPATGDGTEIWKALPGPGSFFHPALSDRVLMWGAHDKIVFPWEHTGWLHLYAVAAVGGTPAELTTGANYEIFNISLSPDRTRVVYSANDGDIERWHLWQVGLAGGPPQRLTGGKGIEDYPVITSDGAVVALHGGARSPIVPVELGANGVMQPVAPQALPASFPSAQPVDPQTVVFPAADGLTIHGQLFLPRHRATQRGPAVLFFHGGPYRQMFPAFHPMDAYSFMYAFNQYLTDEGYVVLSVNYRGGIGYGLDFREAKNFGAAGASELNDILGAAAFLHARHDLDPKRLGIWGGSYGGLMTALGLARGPDLFAAGVDYAGVHDWRLELPQLKGAAADLAYRSSALSTMDRWHAPVLVVHNDDDRDVPFAESMKLVEALRTHGVPFEQLVMPDEVHVMLRAASWERFFAISDNFLARYLR
ncbi:MAG TPA: prolyl oligopeptidase family serine peptidase [Acetobacteraceae bacterium]|nr:prolyl oligopeptidase family serine peptidase [Acetobacteraceae bacterium]